MSQRICSVPGCERPCHGSRFGWCATHATRMRNTGTLDAPQPKPIVTRLMERIERVGDCWIWQGSKNQAGYGTVSLGKAGRAGVHRVSYEIFVGPIPDGLVIDHLCKNPSCINPEHLEPVTQRENVHRGNSMPARVRRSGLCNRGLHSWSPPGRCKPCATELRLEYQRKREAADPAVREARLAYNREYSLRRRREAAANR